MRYTPTITCLLLISLSLNAFALDSKLLNVPEGFSIEVFAQELDQPRQMAEGKNGTIFVGERGGQIVALFDTDKNGQVDSKRVIGMAGILDTARFSTFIAEELNVSVESVNAYVLGGHGDTMVPVIGATNVGGVPVENMIEKNRLESIVQRTRDGGAEIVALLKTGSAFYAPSASIVQMVEAILLDKQQILPCAALLNGEYGFNDVYAGVPVKLGANGIEEIIEVDLNKDEHSALSKSVDSVIELLDIMKKN